MWCRFPALVTAVTLCALCFLVVSADEDDSGSSDSNEAHEVMKEQLIVSPDNKEEDQDSDDEEATIFLGTSNDRSVPEMSCKNGTCCEELKAWQAKAEAEAADMDQEDTECNEECQKLFYNCKVYCDKLENTPQVCSKVSQTHK